MSPVRRADCVCGYPLLFMPGYGWVHDVMGYNGSIPNCRNATPKGELS